MAVLKILYLFLLFQNHKNFAKSQTTENFPEESTTEIADDEVTHVLSKNLSGNVKLTTLQVLSTLNETSELKENFSDHTVLKNKQIPAIPEHPLLTDLSTKEVTDVTESFGLMDVFNTTSGTLPDQTTELLNQEIIYETTTFDKTDVQIDTLKTTTEDSETEGASIISTTDKPFGLEELVNEKGFVQEMETSSIPSMNMLENQTEEIHSTIDDLLSTSTKSIDMSLDQSTEEVEDVSSFINIDKEFLSTVSGEENLSDLEINTEKEFTPDQVMTNESIKEETITERLAINELMKSTNFDITTTRNEETTTIHTDDIIMSTASGETDKNSTHFILEDVTTSNPTVEMDSQTIRAAKMLNLFDKFGNIDTNSPVETTVINEIFFDENEIKFPNLNLEDVENKNKETVTSHKFMVFENRNGADETTTDLLMETSTETIIDMTTDSHDDEKKTTYIIDATTETIPTSYNSFTEKASESTDTSVSENLIVHENSSSMTTEQVLSVKTEATNYGTTTLSQNEELTTSRNTNPSMMMTQSPTTENYKTLGTTILNVDDVKTTETLSTSSFSVTEPVPTTAQNDLLVNTEKVTATDNSETGSSSEGFAITEAVKIETSTVSIMMNMNSTDVPALEVSESLNDITVQNSDTTTDSIKTITFENPDEKVVTSTVPEENSTDKMKINEIYTVTDPTVTDVSVTEENGKHAVDPTTIQNAETTSETFSKDVTTEVSVTETMRMESLIKETETTSNTENFTATEASKLLSTDSKDATTTEFILKSSVPDKTEENTTIKIENIPAVTESRFTMSPNNIDEAISTAAPETATETSELLSTVSNGVITTETMVRFSSDETQSTTEENTTVQMTESGLEKFSTVNVITDMNSTEIPVVTEKSNNLSMTSNKVDEALSTTSPEVATESPELFSTISNNLNTTEIMRMESMLNSSSSDETQSTTEENTTVQMTESAFEKSSTTNVIIDMNSKEIPVVTERSNNLSMTSNKLDEALSTTSPEVATESPELFSTISNNLNTTEIMKIESMSNSFSSDDTQSTTEENSTEKMTEAVFRKSFTVNVIIDMNSTEMPFVTERSNSLTMTSNTVDEALSTTPAETATETSELFTTISNNLNTTETMKIESMLKSSSSDETHSTTEENTNVQMTESIFEKSSTANVIINLNSTEIPAVTEKSNSFTSTPNKVDEALSTTAAETATETPELFTTISNNLNTIETMKMESMLNSSSSNEIQTTTEENSTVQLTESVFDETLSTIAPETSNFFSTELNAINMVTTNLLATATMKMESLLRNNPNTASTNVNDVNKRKPKDVKTNAEIAEHNTFTNTIIHMKSVTTESMLEITTINNIELSATTFKTPTTNEINENTKEDTTMANESLQIVSEPVDQQSMFSQKLVEMLVPYFISGMISDKTNETESTTEMENEAETTTGFSSSEIILTSTEPMKETDSTIENTIKESSSRQEKKLREIDIKIIDKNTSFSIPRDALLVFKNPNIVNITWKSQTSDMNNSLELEFDKTLQLNFVKDSQMHIYKTTLLNKSSDDRNLIELENGVQIYISNLDFFKELQKHQMAITADKSDEAKPTKVMAAQVAGGCVGAFVLCGIFVYIAIRKHKAKKRNFKPNHNV